MSTPAARTATLGEALREVVDFRLSNVHTCMPGKINSYDKDKQVAEVQLCVKRRVHTESGEDILEDYPVLPNVRVEFNQTASFFMSFPLAAGDFVWVFFSEQAMDAWFTHGGTAIEDPIDRRFDLSDAFAIPARNPQQPLNSTSNDGIVIGATSPTGLRSVFKEGEILLGENATKAVALAPDSQTEMQKITTLMSAWAAVWATPIPEAGMGSPSAFATALNIATNAAGGVPTINSPASSKVKAE